MTAPLTASQGGQVGGSFWIRHGWKALLGLVLVIGLFGVGDLFLGLDADPAIPDGVAGMSPAEMRETSPDLARLAELQVRAGGIQLIVTATLWTVVLVFPFRRGERWAWWSMWTLPGWAMGVALLFFFVDLQPGRPTPPPAISGWVFFALTAILLLVTRRGVRSPT